MAFDATIIDLGIGNIGSLVNMLKFLKFNVCISSSEKEIKEAKRLILAGVGAFDAAASAMKEKQLSKTIQTAVTENKTPLLGICLGMQILFEKSEEGKLAGLGLIEGEVLHLSKITNQTSKKNERIPHMGWNYIEQSPSSKLLDRFETPPRFYFVHSYFCSCMSPENSAGKTIYGLPFTSVVEKENIFGVQFHPEKSHKFGMTLLETFCSID